MKRDMELVRAILLAVEAKESGAHFTKILECLPYEDRALVEYHMHMLLDEVCLLKGDSIGDEQGEEWLDLQLTWNGHEFLEAVRDPEVWRRTKEGAKAAGNAGLGFMWELAKAYGKHVAKERLGIEL